MQIMMIAIKMLIGLIVIAIVLSMLYAIGRITARITRIDVDPEYYLMLGLMVLMCIAVGIGLSYVIGSIIIH